MKQILIVLLFFIGVHARAESHTEPQNEFQEHQNESQEHQEYKGFVAFHGGTEFQNDLTDPAEVFSLTYGGLVTTHTYLGSFEIGTKIFSRKYIPITLSLKYSYSILRNDGFELGPDISLFIAGDQAKDSNETVIVFGNEVGLFAMKFITHKISLLIRTGLHTEPLLQNPLIYIDGGIRWYFL